jgi:hypothetical protein
MAGALPGGAAGPRRCMYEIEPASESRCSISLPMRSPPVALMYWSSSAGEDANGSVSSEYESCMRRGMEGSSANASGDDALEGESGEPDSDSIQRSDGFIEREE